MDDRPTWGYFADVTDRLCARIAQLERERRECRREVGRITFLEAELDAVRHSRDHYKARLAQTHSEA